MKHPIYIHVLYNWYVWYIIRSIIIVTTLCIIYMLTIIITIINCNWKRLSKTSFLRDSLGILFLHEGWDILFYFWRYGISLYAIRSLLLFSLSTCKIFTLTTVETKVSSLNLGQFPIITITDTWDDELLFLQHIITDLSILSEALE